MRAPKPAAQTQYTYDRTDQLVKQNDGTHGDQSFTYDAFGGLTTKVETAATASSLTYNALGLTTAYNVGGQNSIAMAYDALGRLATRTAATTETYRYAGTSAAIVKADTGTPSTSALSIVDPQGARLSVSAANAASPSWALFDTLGSMAALVSPAAALTATYRFDGYGEPIVDTTRAANPYGFTGALNAGTDTTPLYVLGARLYAPSIGAFSSMDSYAGTSADPLSMNRFLYAGANPTTLVDPTGHDFCTEITPGYYAGCAGSSGDTMSEQQLHAYDSDTNDHHAAKKDGPATAPDKPVMPATGTMAWWRLWWANADPYTRLRLEGRLFGREVTDMFGDVAPIDLVCLASDAGPDTCRSFWQLSLLRDDFVGALPIGLGIAQAEAIRGRGQGDDADTASDPTQDLLDGKPVPYDQVKVGVDAAETAATEGGTAVVGADGTSPISYVVDATAGGEIYYRTMSAADYASLRATGRVSATSETFVSPSVSYAATYDGVTVRITVRPGTTGLLVNMGVRDTSPRTSLWYPDMPIVSKGWWTTSAYFKSEGGIINIGLGQGSALGIFNASIVDYAVVGGQ